MTGVLTDKVPQFEAAERFLASRGYGHMRVSSQGVVTLGRGKLLVWHATKTTLEAEVAEFVRLELEPESPGYTSEYVSAVAALALLRARQGGVVGSEGESADDDTL